MKAVVGHAFGPPESLALQERPGRAPGAGEVRLRLRFAGVTFVDALVSAGRHQHKPALPFIPGTEGAGTVIETGPDVAQLAPGDAVCTGAMGGLFAQDVTLPASRVQRLPQGVDLAAAAVLRASYFSAWYALIERGAVQAGETVLVLGAAGAIGVAACQLARLHGATVIAAASTPEKRAFALAQGAQHALDPAAPDFADQLKALAGPGGLDIVVDPVGGSLTETAFRRLGYKGRHLMVGFASGTIPSLPANLPLLKGASLVGVLASYFDGRFPEAALAAREKILALFAEGRIAPPVGRVFPLEEYAAAMRAVAEGKVLGRVILDLS